MFNFTTKNCNDGFVNLKINSIFVKLKPHTKIYLKHFGYSETDFIHCEICGARAVDINHIECRGMGGSKQKDSIENLMAVCRKCHIEYGDKKQWKEWLKYIHQAKLNKHGK